LASDITAHAAEVAGDRRCAPTEADGPHSRITIHAKSHIPDTIVMCTMGNMGFVPVVNEHPFELLNAIGIIGGLFFTG